MGGWQFLSCIVPLSIAEGKGLYDRLPVLDQKIPDWLIKITFLGEDETAIRSSIKSKFVIMGFYQE